MNGMTFIIYLYSLLIDIDSLAVNVWPQEAPDGCQVNIEYTLKRTDMALNDVVITVPLP